MHHNNADGKFMNEIVEMLTLEDKLKNMPGSLSEGQQQRAAITRALITKPAPVCWSVLQTSTD